MSYTTIKSAKLTFVITCIFCVLLAVLTIGSFPLLVWFFGEKRMSTIATVTTAFYLCCPAAWIALISIIKLLRNIIKDEIFTLKNVSLMRILSWCCAFVAVACFIMGLRYVPLFIFSLGAAFMMLILRVLKNVMARATEIKNENELTI